MNACLTLINWPPIQRRHPLKGDNPKKKIPNQKIFWTQNFFGPGNFFRHKVFLDPKIFKTNNHFWAQFFMTQNFLGALDIYWPIFFRAKHYFGPKIFFQPQKFIWTYKNFRPKSFLWSTFFWPNIIYKKNGDLKRINSNLYWQPCSDLKWP